MLLPYINFVSPSYFCNSFFDLRFLFDLSFAAAEHEKDEEEETTWRSRRLIALKATLRHKEMLPGDDISMIKHLNKYK